MLKTELTHCMHVHANAAQRCDTSRHLPLMPRRSACPPRNHPSAAAAARANAATAMVVDDVACESSAEELDYEEDARIEVRAANLDDVVLTSSEHRMLRKFEDLDRDHVGIVFQNFHLVPTMTALENVTLPLEFAGRDAPFAQAREQLEAVGLGHRLAHYPGQLSGGEQQRVALARAFVTEPKLLLADEPTGSLDKDTGDAIIELLFALQKRFGTTLILVTHAPELASRCTRIVQLVDGRIEGMDVSSDDR